MQKSVLPASQSKHVDLLHHPLPRDSETIFTLRQISSQSGTSNGSNRQNDWPVRSGSTNEAQSTGTTGTTLWLGAQVMAAYLSDISSISSSRPEALLRTGVPGSAIEDLSEPGPSRGRGQLSSGRRKRCIDLGSGVGYLALCFAAWGWDVVATDIEPVMSSVLGPNIEDGMNVLTRRYYRNKSSQRLTKSRKENGSEIIPPVTEQRAADPGGLEGVGRVRLTELDWFSAPAPGSAFVSTSNTELASVASTRSSRAETGSLQLQGISPISDRIGFLINDQPIDMIITTDTFYTPSLIVPLWQTIAHLSRLPLTTPPLQPFEESLNGYHPDERHDTPYDASSGGACGRNDKSISPQILIALENRDPGMITAALDVGRKMGFELKQVPVRKVAKSVLACWGWNRGDWEGVEVWKAKWAG